MPDSAILPTLLPTLCQHAHKNEKLQIALKIVEYYKLKGYTLFSDPGHLNIVYFEGLNPDFSLNKDRIDEWNDLRCVFAFNSDGNPYIVFSAVCTTEPGYAELS